MTLCSSIAVFLVLAFAFFLGAEGWLLTGKAQSEFHGGAHGSRRQKGTDDSHPDAMPKRYRQFADSILLTSIHPWNVKTPLPRFYLPATQKVVLPQKREESVRQKLQPVPAQLTLEEEVINVERDDKNQQGPLKSRNSVRPASFVGGQGASNRND